MNVNIKKNESNGKQDAPSTRHYTNSEFFSLKVNIKTICKGKKCNYLPKYI